MAIEIHFRYWGPKLYGGCLAAFWARLFGWFLEEVVKSGCGLSICVSFSIGGGIKRWSTKGGSYKNSQEMASGAGQNHSTNGFVGGKWNGHLTLVINWWRGFLYLTVGSLAIFKPAVSAYPKRFWGMKIDPSLNGWEHLEAKGVGARFYEVNSKEKPQEKNSTIRLWRNLSWMKGCQLQSGCGLMFLSKEEKARACVIGWSRDY